MSKEKIALQLVADAIRHITGKWSEAEERRDHRLSEVGIVDERTLQDFVKYLVVIAAARGLLEQDTQGMRASLDRVTINTSIDQTTRLVAFGLAGDSNPPKP